MATGGMSFRGGNYQMNVSLDASKAIDVAKELDAVLEKVGTTLRNISRGRDVSELWNQQAASIDNVAQALERYAQNINSVGNAEDLIKSLNAFKAWNPEIGDADIFSHLREGAEDLISTAGKLAANLDSAFDVSSLRNAFDAFEALKSAGVDVSDIVEKLSQGDVSHLTDKIQELERQLVRTKIEAQELQDQVNKYESGEAFDQMREKLNQLEDMTERAQKEFASFLSSIGFAGHDIEPGNSWGQFSGWFEAIADGSMTAKEAIAQFKRENAGMFDSVNQSDLSMIVDRLEQLAASIEEVRQSMTQMGGSGSADMQRVFEGSAEAAKTQNAEMQQLGANAAVLETLIQELTRLAEASASSGEAAQTASGSLTQLLSAIDGLSKADPSALESIAEALRSLSRMDGLSVGKASMQNLVSALESLSRLPNNGSLTSLSTVDLRNFNDLHISKASLSNMAEFLPTISGINVSALQRLASIDWSGLNSLNISKASVSGLSQLLGSVGASGLNLDGTKIGLDETGLSTLSRSIEDAIQRASQNIKLTIDNVELSGAARRNIEDAARQAASGTGRKASDESADNAAKFKEEQKALNDLISLYQQYYALESKKISAVNKGDIENADVYRARAQSIWEEISRIEELNPKLAELAGQHDKVTEAVRKWQAAANSGQARSDANMAKRLQEDAKALEEYRKQLSQLSLNGSGNTSVKFAGDASAVAQYEAELTELQSRFNAIATAAEAEKSAAVAAFEEQRQKVEDLRASLNSTASSAKEAAALSQQYATFRNQLQAFTVANPRAYNLNKSEIDSWFASIDSGANQSSAALSAMKLRFTEINGEMRTMGTQGKTFFQQLRDGWRKFGGWSLVTRSFTKVISEFKKAVTAVKEVDAAMTELRKVTDLTERQYDSLYKKMVTISGEVGAKLSDVITSVGDFSRLGYNAADALSLSDAALVYFNVGDQLESINEATESIISTMKAFGIEASNAMSIVDMFNEVGNNFAISSSGIGEALMRSASALATAGNSIEESIGLIVAANDVVQNPEVVGTAMKTLAMYMRTMKTEAEEAGLATDGMAESTSKLREELLALTGGKLDIQIDDKHLKSTYQVLQELSEIWDEIGRVSPNNQARILEMLGGKRNANVLSSIITNFDDAVAAMETAGKSAGSAWMENEKYLNSVEGKTKQVQAAFEAFANSVINSDIVKTWLDIQKGILNAGSALNEIGLLLPTIAAGMNMIKGVMDAMNASKAASKIMTYLNAGNAPNSDSIQSVIAGLTSGQQRALSINLNDYIKVNGGTTGLQDVVNLLNRNIGATNTFKTSLVSMGATAKTVFAGLKASMMSSGILALISLAIEAVVKCVQWISTAKQRAIEAAEEVTNAYSEQAKSTSDNIKRLTELSKDYEDLNSRAGANGTQGSLNTDEYERYKKIIDEIASISPKVISGFDGQTAALKDYSTAIQDAIAYQNDLLDNQKRVMVNDAEKVYSGARAQIRDLYKDMKKYTYEIYDAFAPSRNQPFGDTKGDTEKWLSVLDAVGIKLDEIVEKTGEKNVEYHTSRISDVWLRSYDYLEQIYAKQDQIREAMQASGNYEEKQVSEVINKIANLSKILPKYETYVKSVQDVLIAYADTDIGLSSMLDRDKLTPKQLDEYYQGIMQIADASKTFGEQKEEVEEYTKLFADLFGDIDYAKSAGTFDLMWERWGELQEKYKDSPYLLDLIRDALFGTSEAARENADVTDDLAQSYANLEKILSKISGFNGFLNKARSGSEDPFGMISSAKDITEAYNEIVALTDGQKIDWTDMVEGTGDGGEIIWDTNAIENYIKEIVNAAVANTEFANDHPEVIAYLENVATGFDDAAKSAKSLGDALSSMKSIDDLIQRIENFDGSDAEAFELVDDLQAFVEQWNKILASQGLEPIDLTRFVSAEDGKVDFTNTIAALREFRDAVINDNDAMAALKDTSPELYNVIVSMGTQADESSKSVYQLSDAMSALSSVSKFLTDGLDTSDPLSAIDDALGVLENWNAALKSMGMDGEKTLADLIIIDDHGGVSEKAEAFRAAYTDIAKAAIDANEALSDVEKESLKLQIDSWMDDLVDTAKAKEKADEIKNAFSEIGDAYAYAAELQKYNSGESDTSYFDMLERMYDFAAKYDDISIKDLWDFDTGSFKDLGEIQIDKMLDEIATDLKINAEEVDAWKQRVKAGFEAAAEAASAYETASDSIGMAGSLSGFLSDVQSGDKGVLDMLSSAVSLSKDLGVTLEDVYSIDAFGNITYNTNVLVGAFEQYIDDLVAAGSLNQQLADAIKQAARAEGELSDEAAEAAQRMADALSSMSSIGNFIQSGITGDMDFISLIQSAQSEVEAWNEMVENGLAAEKINIFDLIETGDGKAKINVSAARKRYEELAEAYTDEMIKAFRRENERNGVQDVITGTGTWIDGLTKEQVENVSTFSAEFRDFIDTISTPVPPTLGDLASDISTLQSAINDFAGGSSADGNFLEAIQQFTSLNEQFGNGEWKFSDFFKWDGDEFVYKTEILTSKFDELATAIATDLVDSEIAAGALIENRVAEIEIRAERIKGAIGQVASTWDQLTSAISSVNDVQGVKSTYDSYLAGNTSLLDMISSLSGVAQAFGLSVEEAFSIGSDGMMVLNIEAIDNGLLKVIDNLETSGACSAEFARQLREAAKQEMRVNENAQRMQRAYEDFSGSASFGSGRYRGQQLTYDDYKAMIERNSAYAQAVEYVNGVMTINVDTYNKLTDEMAQQTAEMALMEAAQRKLRYEELEKELKTNTELTDDNRESIRKEIDKLKLEANGYLVLANEIANATSQFERFRNAAGDSDTGTYMDAKSALKMINDVMYNVESELYGQLGNEKFQEAIKLLIDPDIDFSDPNWIQKVQQELDAAKDNLEKYFGEGEDQTTRGNMSNFFNDLLAQGFATVQIDEAGKKWGQLNGTVEDMANAFGISKDAIRAALQELQLFSGINFDWEHIDPEYYEEVMQKAEEAKAAAEEAEAEAKRLQEEADAAKARSEEAAKELEEAKASGDESKTAEAEEAAAEASKNAEEAQKAADDAAKSAEKAAAEAAGLEETGTEQLKQSLEDIVARVNDIQSNPIDLDVDGAIESAQGVLDKLTEILEKIEAINAARMFISQDGGNQNGGSPTGGDHTGGVDLQRDYTIGVRFIASAGMSDVTWNTGDHGELDLQKLAEQFIPENYNGNVDLTNRKAVPIKMLADVGWCNEDGTPLDGDYATLFTNTFSAGDTSKGFDFAYDANVVCNITPILADGTVLSEDAMWDYIEQIVSESQSTGKSLKEVDEEHLNLLLSIDVVEDDTSLEEAFEHACEWAEKLHELQEEWDKVRFHIDLSGDNTSGEDGGVGGLTSDLQNTKAAVEELNNTKADIDTTAGVTSVSNLSGLISDAKDGVTRLNGSKIGISTLPTITSINNVILALTLLGKAIDGINQKKINVPTSTKGSSGGSTPSASGASGAIGIQSSSGGKTLVGELGREMVVDVNSGRWYTVGNHGPEMVNLPKRAIVYDHERTEELLGLKSFSLSGLSMASGSKGPGTNGNSGVRGGAINVDALETSTKTTEKAAKTVSSAADKTTNALEDIKNSLDEANELMEHYIQHVEQDYYVHERASDYPAMQGDLYAEAEYYRKIYEQSMKAVKQMKKAGATENDEELRAAEEAAWSAYKSMYDAIDKSRDLIKDALNDTIDEIQSAFSSLKDAVQEYNDTGFISMDTFQAIIENGIQYLAYMRDEDGQLKINTDSIHDLIQARKDQLAIETALAYVSRLREALRNGETETIKKLVDGTNELGDSSWGLVYAQLAIAKAEGLSDEEYKKALENINTLRDLAKIVDEDMSSGGADAIEQIKNRYESLNDQIEHYIKHLEQEQKVADRFANYHGTEESIVAQIAEYNKIIADCQKAVEEMKAAGADDTNKDLQGMEEAAWSAQQSIWSLYDELYSLRTGAISDRINDIRTAVNSFQSAIDDINDSGMITMDTFQSIVDNGLQYIRFLEIENGQLSLNRDSIEQMIRARKEELAVETAMSYLNQLEEALLAGETQKVAQLIGLNEDLSESTWAAVYAKLALLRTEGLSKKDAAAVESYIEKLRSLTDMVNTDIAAPTVDTLEDILAEIRDKFDEIREDIEHYIAHQEQAFTVNERAMDYSGMASALRNEINYYSQIYEEAQKTIHELIANGADDTSEVLQGVEESAWSAYNSMNEAFDRMNALRVDALNEELGRLTGTFNTLQSVIDEYNEHGAISVDSFESILSGGIQYLTFLEKEDGQYKMNASSLRDYISARKEQLAIETAMQYINNLRQALENDELLRVNSLIDASNEMSSSTWNLVFARAAELKSLGLTDAQYSLMIDNLKKLREMSRDVESDLGAWSGADDPVERLKDAFSDLNKEIEHYIAHQEQAYKEAERGWNFSGMERALQNEVGYYRRIYEEAQKTINEMRRNGADDTTESLQNMEESQWKAANAMNEALDKIRALRVDALKKEVNNLTSSFNALKSAADDYNKSGGITLDTFNSIVDGGMQYLSLLDEENGQYVIATDRLQDYVQMRKEQLAIETALSYVSELSEALANGETERLNRLTDATNGLSSSTWDLVYANAAALKASGLSNEQYETIVGNIDRLRAIAKSVNTDLTSAEGDLSSSFDSQKDALNKILKYTEDLIRAEANDRIKAIKDEIDAYKKIIDLKKESLKQTKDENEYQEEVADKVKEIAQLQSKADLLALDTSRSAGAERQKLMQEIMDKQNELSKYQSDYAYDAQVEALDKEAEAYEESRQGEIEAIEASVSSEEKVYQLAIARIRDQWDTLYSDLIEWNTEQGNVINQEITDAWEEAYDALRKYGDYLSAISHLESQANGLNGNGNMVVADIPKYHGGGVAGDKGKLNDEEVLAVLQKGELVVDREQKKGLYTVVDFVKTLGDRLGTSIGNLRNLRVPGQMMPEFAGMASPESASVVENNNISFSPAFNVTIGGDVSDPASAREFGQTLAKTAADSLFDRFNRRGINALQTLRQ